MNVWRVEFPGPHPATHSYCQLLQILLDFMEPEGSLLLLKPNIELLQSIPTLLNPLDLGSLRTPRHTEQLIKILIMQYFLKFLFSFISLRHKIFFST